MNDEAVVEPALTVAVQPGREIDWIIASKSIYRQPIKLRLMSFQIKLILDTSNTVSRSRLLIQHKAIFISEYVMYP